jgi:hypothetical protein
MSYLLCHSQFHDVSPSTLSGFENVDCKAMLAKGDFIGLVQQQARRNHDRLLSSVKSTGFNPWLPSNASLLIKELLSGKYLLYDNLPKPFFQRYRASSFAGSSILGCLTDILAFGFKLDTIAPPAREGIVTQIGESKRAQQILDNVIRVHGKEAILEGSVKVIYVYLWQDDFDASATKTKANHVSVKICTMTIAPPPDCANSLHYTYLRVFGTKNDKEGVALLEICSDCSLRHRFNSGHRKIKKTCWSVR